MAPTEAPPQVPPMPGGDTGQPPQGAPEGLLGPDQQPTPQSPTGQSQEDIVKAQMRRFHEMEQQVMRAADLEKDAMALSSTFPQIAQEMRGVGQLLQPLKGVRELLRSAMAKVATQSGRGQEPPAPRGQA